MDDNPNGNDDKNADRCEQDPIFDDYDMNEDKCHYETMQTPVQVSSPPEPFKDNTNYTSQ